jgi:spermidine synthase
LFLQLPERVHCTMPDRFVDDSRLSFRIFMVGLGVVLAAALVGLATWPHQALGDALVGGSRYATFIAIQGFSLIFVILFWGGRPPAWQCWTVLVIWLPMAWAIWVWLHGGPAADLADAGRLFIPNVLTVGMAVPCVALMVWRLLRPPASLGEFERRWRWLAVLTLLFTMLPPSALTLTGRLHPFTLDLNALHFDRLAGLDFRVPFNDAINAVPGLWILISVAYGFTPLAFVSLALLHLRRVPAHAASGILVWVVLTAAALLAYNVFPITGPRYVFGADHFLHALSEGAKQPFGPIKVAMAPRNGMPSMHFGWLLAASILWWQSGTRAWSRALMIATTVCTALATLYLGEHYLVDLIVAVPFVLAVLAGCARTVPWAARERWLSVLLGAAAWLVWVVVLRFGMPALVAWPALCWLMIAATAAVVVWQARALARFATLVEQQASAEPVPVRVPVRLTVDERRFGLMFMVSGMAALVYQVLFAKKLALVFGSTSTATFTVLATFLGGMAIGSVLGGWLAGRLKRPLVGYAMAELAIAGYCVLTGPLFDGIQHLYVLLAAGHAPDAPVLLALRVLLGGAVLLVPTVMMGATLPLLASALGRQGQTLGGKVAWLYFANTGGAALGALLTGYFIIPAVGAQSTTLLAALGNLLVALAALQQAKAAEAASGGVATADTDLTTASASAALALPRGAVALALLSLGAGGVLSLGLEVTFVHQLSIVAGNSVYAFGLMLCTFLLGLALGGEGARRLVLQQPGARLVWLGGALAGMATMVALSAWAWNAVPDYFGSYAGYPAATTFVSREALRGLVCALIMMPSAVFIGASYAMAMDVITTRQDAGRWRRLGLAAGLNTLGNIAGVLLFGFWALPHLGGMGSNLAIAGVALALSAIVMAAAERGRLRLRAVPVLVAALAVALGHQATLDYDKLSSGANVYFAPQSWGHTIDVAESIDGGLTTVATQPKAGGGVIKTLLTNGKFQGSDSTEGEMRAQLGFAMAPLLHQDRREQALVIGYGTGVTSRVFADAGFRHLDVAELSHDIVRLADRHFSAVNGQVSSRPNVKVNLTDGRNLLLLSNQRYDIISIEITSIWFAGAASLYNREFYQLAKTRLQPDGVLQQWLQLHRLNALDILSIVATLRSEFRYVSLYVMGGQGILVASNDAARGRPSDAAMARLKEQASLADLRGVLGRPVDSLVGDRVLDADGVDRLLANATASAEAWWSTDNNLLLEYQTPKANANDSKASQQANLAWLSQFAVHRP